MSDPKPFASLGPSLLARKGTARPAMRPQLAVMAANHPDDAGSAVLFGEDLGWNDMGHDATKVAQPAPDAAQVAAPADELPRLAGLIRPAGLIRSDGRRSALADGRRCAFTLRVDAERHLKLRLACTLRNRSAQQLLTEALDQLLGELPELAGLARQMAQQAQN